MKTNKKYQYQYKKVVHISYDVEEENCKVSYTF